MYKQLCGVLLACCCAMPTANVMAKVTPDAAAALGKELTPYGAERAGNQAGTIPPWDGGLTPERAGQNNADTKTARQDPYQNDKILYKITASNMAQYLDILPVGIQTLLKTYPDTYYVPVYPTHRSASAPQWVYDNVAKNALTAELVNGGSGFKNGFGGIPFPIPKNEQGAVDPLMILWNHMTRWRGIYIVRSSSEALVQKNRSYNLITSQQEADFLYYHRDGNFNSIDNVMVRALSYIKSPPRLAGGAVLVHETLDQTREPRMAWAYSVGQRRVRRAPNLAYDTPVPSTDGLVIADEVDMFNGAPDRYEWTFLGKKEMLIPYNNYKLNSPQFNYDNLLLKGHINPEATRFELHRVWVVEGKVKTGERHIYSRRTFYVDEDSWNIAVTDQYDARGELWRINVSHLMNYYEVPAAWTALDVFHDVNAQRYFAAFMDSEEGNSLKFSDQPPPDGYFSPQALRRLGTR